MPTKISGIYEFIHQMARHNSTKVLPLTNQTKLTLTVTLTLTDTVSLTLTLTLNQTLTLNPTKPKYLCALS